MSLLLVGLSEFDKLATGIDGVALQWLRGSTGKRMRGSGELPQSPDAPRAFPA
jgi:hypothetical protein